MGLFPYFHSGGRRTFITSSHSQEIGVTSRELSQPWLWPPFCVWVFWRRRDEVVDITSVHKAWVHFRQILNAEQLHHTLHLILQDWLKLACTSSPYSDGVDLLSTRCSAPSDP